MKETERKTISLLISISLADYKERPMSTVLVAK